MGKKDRAKRGVEQPPQPNMGAGAELAEAVDGLRVPRKISAFRTDPHIVLKQDVPTEIRQRRTLLSRRRRRVADHVQVKVVEDGHIEVAKPHPFERPGTSAHGRFIGQFRASGVLVIGRSRCIRKLISNE
jgi:hypothetical protein